MGDLRLVVLQLFSIASDTFVHEGRLFFAAALAFDKSINDENVHPQCHLLLRPAAVSPV